MCSKCACRAGAGGFKRAGKLVDVKAIVEKPTVAYAKEMLGIPNMPEDEVLTMFGLYILNPTIFTVLEERISKNVRDAGEFAFTPALDRLRKEEGVLGFVLEGQRFDIGDPASYLKTLNASMPTDIACRP
jgi:UTP--glucose-1-phosphate uridylyltransferase